MSQLAEPEEQVDRAETRSGKNKLQAAAEEATGAIVATPRRGRPPGSKRKMGKGLTLVRRESHEFGQRLKAYRTSRQLTLEDVAQRMGISKGYIYQLERGTVVPPPDERIMEFARVLQVSPDELFAAAGRVAPDVVVIYRTSPVRMGALMRMINVLGPAGTDLMITRAALEQIRGSEPTI